MKKVFSKLLSKTDIGKRLAIPSKSLGHLIPRMGEEGLDVEVEDCKSGKLWLFRCSVRKGGYLKPVFSGRWCKFVRSKGLSVGDKVKLYKEDNKYKIKSKKAVRIFGAAFGFAAAP